MVASVHNWQFVHSATSMIMFHLYISLASSRWAEEYRSRIEDGCAPVLPSPARGGGEGSGRPAHQCEPHGPPPGPSRQAADQALHFAGTRLAASSIRLTSRSRSISANTAEMCSA